MARKKKQTAPPPIPVVPVKIAATYAPLSAELTPYGTLAYRTPVRADQFTGATGPVLEAVVLDIDGTMQGWGGGLDKTLADWCEQHYRRNPDVVFLVITARDHEYMYETSFNWCMRDFPYAFIGPFCRAAGDPRLASEFKRQLAQGFEDMGLYRIVGAADDNKYVLKMWAHWKATRNPAFDLLECDAYTGYGDWRSGLGSKGKTWGSYYSSPTTATGVTSVATHRPAGTSHYAGTTPAQSKPGAPERDLPPALPTRAELEDQAHHANPHWTPDYIEKLSEVDLREAAGITQGDYREALYDQIAYLFGSHACDDELDELDLIDIEPMLDMTREQIEKTLDDHFQAVLDRREMTDEERQRRQDRMDLEDLAVSLDPTLTLAQAEKLDTQDLLDRIGAIQVLADEAQVTALDTEGVVA
jgi:hypothetical protein